LILSYLGNLETLAFFKDYLNGLINGGDHYLLCHDFGHYVDTQEKIERDYSNRAEWEKKCLLTISRMGFFSSDRSIGEYAENIWKINEIEVLKPGEGEKRVISSTSLKNLDKSNSTEKVNK